MVFFNCLRLFLDLSYKLFLHCYAAVVKISTDTSRRAVRLRQQSFLLWKPVFVFRGYSVNTLVHAGVQNYTSVDGPC